MNKTISYVKYNILTHPGVLFNYLFIIIAFIYKIIIEPLLLKFTTSFFTKSADIWVTLIFNIIFIAEVVLLTIKILDTPHIVYRQKEEKSKTKDKSNFFIVILWVGHLGLHGVFFMFYGIPIMDFSQTFFFGILIFIALKELYLLMLYVHITTMPIEKRRNITVKRRISINISLGIICFLIITITSSTLSEIFFKNTMDQFGLFFLPVAFLMGLLFYLPAWFGFYIEEFYTVKQKSEKINLWISVVLASFYCGITNFL